MSIWDTTLGEIGALVSPDWGGLVLLIPLALVLAVGAYLAWVVRRYANAGPQVSRPIPVAPVPAGTHLPGPSLAPLLAAGGAFALLLSTLFIRIVPGAAPDSSTFVVEPLGIVAISVGILAMVGALLYWGREANREFRALEPSAALTAGSAAAAKGPPAGIHVPGPSFRPLLAAIATAVMLLGLVIDPVVFLAGVLMTVIGLLGWLNDARKEYREVEKADVTGHLENIPAPRFPTGTLIVFGLLLVGSLLIAGGIIPPRGNASGGGSGGTPTPAPTTQPSAAPSGQASAAPSDGGTASAAPGTSAAPGASVTLKLAAQGIAYDTASLEVPANTPFKIEFTNNDAGIPHNVAIHKDSPTGPEVWKGEIFNGVETRTYDVPALPAGAYGFVCTVHPNMTGTLTAK